MDTFSKEETNILKGVAILFMLFFHLFNKYPIGNLYEPSVKKYTQVIFKKSY
jgi:uncharacterized membrane protein